MEDDDARADALDGVEFVGAEENDLAAGGEFLDEAAEDESGADVEAGEGFVEENEVGIVEEGGADEDLLAHALGVAGDGRVAIVVEAEDAEHTVDARRRFFGREVAELRDHGEVFDGREMVVEVGLFGDVAHAALVGDEVVVDGPAVEKDLAGGAVDEAGDHFHRGRLSRPIRAEVAGDLAGAGTETDVIDRGNTRIKLGDTT